MYDTEPPFFSGIEESTVRKDLFWNWQINTKKRLFSILSNSREYSGTISMKEDAKDLVLTRLSSVTGLNGVIGNHNNVSDMIVCEQREC